MEIWGEIKGFENYFVSNKGNVRSIDRIVFIGNSQKAIKGISLKKTVNKDGYYVVSICDKLNSKQFLVHRLVAESFLINKEKKSQVNHMDCNKLNNCVENLEWCTPQENVTHAHKNGLMCTGEKVHKAKLEMDDVYDIRLLNTRFGFNHKQLLKHYPVSRISIDRIIRNETYKSHPITC